MSVVNSKRACFTLNNYDDADVAKFHAAKDMLYLIIGKEVGDSGTPHLQGYITFSKPQRYSALKKIHGQCHWEFAKGSTEENIKYCSKDGDFHELGERPRVGSRGKFIDAIDMIVKGDSITEVALENPEAFARGGRGLRDLKFALTKEYEHDGVRGYWYVGPPGTGKSHKARTDHPGAYIKAQNKWWDGYDGEDVVILEDMDDACLKHYLKIWADKWSCKGETKGGHVHLQHKKFIVTSNFTMEELFGDNQNILEAIKRRFKVTRFGNHAFNPIIQRPVAPMIPGLTVQALDDFSVSLSDMEDEFEMGIEGDIEERWLSEFIN